MISFWKSLSPFQPTLLLSLLLFPTYFVMMRFHSKDETIQQAILQNWARADFALLSLNRALAILPVAALQSGRLTREDSRRICGWAIQGQVALKNLKKSSALFSRSRSTNSVVRRETSACSEP